MSSSHPFKHFFLVCRHRHQVIRNGLHMGIFFHCLRHDLSKYLPSEFIRSAKYYKGTGSPVYNERLNNNYYSKVCQLHTRRNKHHWEYYTDFLAGRIIVRNMPYKYCLEYVADVLSASKTYTKEEFNPSSAYNYFNKMKNHYYFTLGTEEFLTECFKRYSESLFKHLKKKDTKPLYREIMSKYPDTRIFEELKIDVELPKLYEKKD